MSLDLDCPFVVMVWTDTLSLVKKTASTKAGWHCGLGERVWVKNVTKNPVVTKAELQRS